MATVVYRTPITRKSALGILKAYDGAWELDGKPLPWVWGSRVNKEDMRGWRLIVGPYSIWLIWLSSEQ